jgi:hypothetical protein
VDGTRLIVQDVHAAVADLEHIDVAGERRGCRGTTPMSQRLRASPHASLSISSPLSSE